MAGDQDALHQALATSLSEAPASPLVVALSGGLDSTVLLHLAHQFCQSRTGWTLKAVHVDHGLSPNAAQWQAHCEQFCRALGVALVTEQVQVEPGPRQSLEAIAREARYGVLACHLPAAGLLLTGHHRDDQVETLLLMLKRGAGPKGLSGMAGRAAFGRGTLLRPLLAFSRAQLQTYAEAQQLAWIDDESNASLAFDRNFLRHQVLPALRGRWPGFDACAARSAELCAEQQQLVAELAAEDLARAQQGSEALVVDMLQGLSTPRLNNLLRHWLAIGGAPMPSRAQLAQVPALLAAAEDANPCLCWQGWQLRRYRGQLYLLPQSAAPRVKPLPWQDEKRLSIAPDLVLEFAWREGEGIREPAANETVSLRFALPGSTRVHPDNRVHSTTLKQLYKERGIPPWVRGRVPFVFYNEQLVAAAGYWIEKGHGAATTDTGLVIRLAED